jgi:hypothetical protein|tara:strand:+ start:1760 stop:1978 length:219 start_codon:yes stop_codon:yes gene_type:complete
MNELTENNLNQIYDQFSGEQQKILNTMKQKTNFDDEIQEKNQTKEISLLNQLLLLTLKYRNFKRQIKLKGNM